jgi:hypothetical protein
MKNWSIPCIEHLACKLQKINMQMGEVKEHKTYSCKFGSFIQVGRLPDKSLYDKSLQAC